MPSTLGFVCLSAVLIVYSGVVGYISPGDVELS